MDLQEIATVQREFDIKHGWVPKPDDFVDLISFLQQDSVGLAGEVGEVAGVVKKITMEFRHSKEALPSLIRDNKDSIAEELADVLVYVVRIADYLDIDLEREYVRKLEINKSRFERFET